MDRTANIVGPEENSVMSTCWMLTDGPYVERVRQAESITLLLPLR